ncbi:protein unc-93 homolog A-like [Babylonia areolata]|uniref:protein unc-93 homolog A-like n=1 Tax=Babylonia areolata TaxID=304850 RepID=UPI003FD60CE8
MVTVLTQPFGQPYSVCGVREVSGRGVVDEALSTDICDAGKQLLTVGMGRASDGGHGKRLDICDDRKQLLMVGMGRDQNYHQPPWPSGERRRLVTDGLEGLEFQSYERRCQKSNTENSKSQSTDRKMNHVPGTTMTTEEAEKPKPKRVNFRKELLRYQSLRTQQDAYTSDEDPIEQKTNGIWKNFISQCSASFLAVFAVFPSRNLQTSIHTVHDLGKISLCCMYGSYILGCFLTGLILQRFKAKCLLLASLLFHILYSVANIIPSAFTLLPASCLVGLCQPAFWRVQDSLLLGYGLRYSVTAALPPQKALRMFQTVTIVTVHSAQILGNLLSSGLISASDFHCDDDWEELNASPSFSSPPPQHHHEAKVPARNEKWTYTLPFVPIQTRRSPNGSPPVNFYQLLTLIYLCMSVVAMGAVLIFFQSPDVTLQRKLPGWKQKVRDVRKCLTDVRWLLIWCAAVYIGCAQGIIISDISKEYGSDVFGCFIVGYMMVSFGTGNLLAILLLDKMRSCSTHPLFLSTGFLMNVGVLVLTALWRPMESQSSLLLLYTAVWGIVDGTLQSQVQAVVGRYAREERDTAMTTFRVMQGVGLLATFLLSLLTRRLAVSLYLALPLHVLGFLGLVLATNHVGQREQGSRGDKDGGSGGGSSPHSSSPPYTPTPPPPPSHSYGAGGGGGSRQGNSRLQSEYSDIGGDGGEV